MHTLEQLRSGALAGSRRLRLACGLAEFPPEIFALADTLEILDLSDNALTTLPDDLPRLTRLRILFCSNNQFSVLPAVLGACTHLSMIGFKSNRISEVPAAALPPALRWLILTDNRISALPATIGRCTQLHKLMLAGNQLATLPAALAACTQLELLRIAANRLTSLPDWLLAMPQLAWLAFAGNPCSAADEAAATSHAGPIVIAWQQLEVQQQLGEGASGVIHQALWRPASGARAVALNLFKGAITSDGLPGSELAACLSAGSHPHLIAALGAVAHHPEGTAGCVMALVEPAFASLAGPPSLDSCTRDIYRADQHFTLASVLRIATGIAAAARHLHGRGIMHGDLYGHNILHTYDGDALLGDFGAATLLARQTAQASALQRLEVRAFGVLLGELLARCEPDNASGSAALLARLAQLQADCVQGATAARPLFDTIAARLLSSGADQDERSAALA